MAFSARLGEQFRPDLLRAAFMDTSYVEAERRKHVEEMGMQVEDFQLRPNDDMAAKGAALTADTLAKYLRASFPFLPEEGVSAFVNYLTSTDVVADVAFHIGIKDLIQCQVSGWG